MEELVEEIAPTPYVGKMVHYYKGEWEVENGIPTAALIAFVSPVAVDLYLFPDFTTVTSNAGGEFGRTYSPYPKANHWTHIPEEG